MPDVPRPPNESDRLEALAELGLDLLRPDQLTSDLAKVAATLTGCPMGFVTVLDADLQWFRGCFGLTATASAREDAICSYTVLSDKPLVVEDTLTDDRFRTNPFVTDTPHIRFYVGVPVTDGHNQIVGSLCVADTVPRTITETELESLEGLARLVSSQHAAFRRHQGVLSASLDAIITINSDGDVTEFNRAASEMFGYAPKDAIGKPLPSLIIPPSMREAHSQGMKRYFETGEGPVLGKRIEIFAMKSDGTEFPVELAISPVRLADEVQFTAFVRDLSAQKRRDAQLVATRFTVDQAKDAVLWVAPDAGFLYANEAACSGLGYSAEELTTMTVFDIEAMLPPEAWPSHWSELRSRRSLLLESRHRRKDGTTFPVEVSCNYIEIDGESFNCVIARDISERKSTEKNLAQSEERFRDIADAAGEYIWEMDHDYRFVLVTDPLLRQLGRTRDEVLGHTLFEFMPVDQAARLQHVFATAAKTGTPFRNVEHRCTRPNGSERWQRLSGKALIGDDPSDADPAPDQPPLTDSGRLLGFRGMGLDVTEFKIAGDQRKREAQLQAAVRAFLSILLDPDAFSDAIARLLSEVGTFLGATQAYFAVPEDQGFRCVHAWSASEDGADIDWERVRTIPVPDDVRRDSPSIQIDSDVSPSIRSVFGLPHSVCLDVITGHSLHAILCFEGATPLAPRSEREIDLLKSAADSLALAIERTERKQQLEEAAHQLSDALSRANEANDSKTAFLANMSHELRTPLTAVLGFARMLEDVSMGVEERRSLIAKIRSNGNSLLGIINAILDLSKIESGNIAVRDDEVDMADMIRDAVSAVAPAAESKDLALRVSIGSQVPVTARTDRMKTVQILVNLLSNAVRYTEAGEVALRLSGHDRDGQFTITYEVADTGPGIAASELDSIFEAFDRGSTTVTGGTGLGLAIARHLAAALRGDLTVDSSPGDGTCFTLTVPISSCSESHLPRRDLPIERLAPSDRSESVGSRLDGVRILLVEDSEHVREVVAYFLHERGALVSFCENGEEAVQFMQTSAESVDLILMDMQMPVLDGYEATRSLRQMQCPVPIIALTAHGMKHERDRCLAAGCDDYASKPVDPDALSQTIRLWVRRTSTQTSPKASENVLADLEARFRVHLASEGRFLADTSQHSDLDQIRRRVHKLAGAAGNLGFPQVTDAARACENSIRLGNDNLSIAQSISRLAEVISESLRNDS